MNGNFTTEQRTMLVLLKSIPKRLIELVIKLISVKGFVLALATWLLVMGRIESWVWYAVAVIVIGAKLGDKAISNIRVSK